MKLEQMTLRTIYNRLVRMGVDITEEEFNAKKEQLLGL